MAEVKRVKRNDKTVLVTMPKTLCSKEKVDFENRALHSASRKSRSVESRSYSNEKKKRSGVADYQQINLDKLEFSDKYENQKRYASNSSLGSLSPNKRYSQIPIPSRFQMNQRSASPVKTRSPSPIAKKSPRPIKGKIAPIEPDLNLKKLHEPRAPSPIKKIGFIRTSTPKKTESKARCFFPSRTSREDKSNAPKSPKKKSSKTTLTNERPVSPVKRRTSKTTTVSSQKSKNKKNQEISFSPILPTNIGEKNSTFDVLNLPDTMDLDLLGDLCPSKGSFFDLDGKKSETGMHIPLTLKLSSDSCRKSPSVIRTISGHELLLSPSFQKEMEDETLGDIAFSQLIEETEKKFDDKFDKLQVFHDDANEYDSEATTDSIPICKNSKSDILNPRHLKKNNPDKTWKTHEEDLFNDVSYRQSVYHPAVVRQKNQEESTGGKNTSVEGSLGASEVSSKGRGMKNNFKRKQSPSSWNRTPGMSNLRSSWNEKNIELNCKEVCKELEKMQEGPSALVKDFFRSVVLHFRSFEDPPIKDY